MEMRRQTIFATFDLPTPAAYVREKKAKEDSRRHRNGCVHPSPSSPGRTGEADVSLGVFQHAPSGTPADYVRSLMATDHPSTLGLSGAPSVAVATALHVDLC